MRAAALLFGALILSACGEGEAGSDSAARVLEAANASKDRAMVAGDPAALENFYTADYRFIDSNGAVRDKAAQVKAITEGMDLLSASSSDVKVGVLGKNSAVVSGRLKGKYRRDGEEHSLDEHYTRIWVTEDSQWRLRHEHSSEVKPPR